MKAALVYDRVNKWGGAERVLLQLQKLFPNAPLYTSVYNPQAAPWAKKFVVKPSFLQKITYAHSSHEILAPFMPIAFESFSFEQYDLVISITSEAAKGIITKPSTIHICYCLTPTRYLWSGYDEYFKDKIFRLLSKPVVAYLQKWDKIAVQRPDAYIAISKEVQKRIKKYYKRDSVVIYPPVSISHPEFISGSRMQQKEKKMQKLVQHDKNKDYFLVVSRLVTYKRIDIAILACNKLKIPLKIIGSGSSELYLKSISGSTIEFLGNLTDTDLVRYYKNCQALIFPGIEDFGLTVLEAQSFGKPVIALKGGGAIETVIEGKTGIFFYPQTTYALIEAFKKFNEMTFNEADCIKQAEKFSKERFKKQFMNEIQKLVQNDKKKL